jgi:hypothetical protein
MSIPTHNPNNCIKVKLFPTKCKYCGESIFYFECKCGSKVFFDNLGEPWSIHNYNEILRLLIKLQKTGIRNENLKEELNNYSKK